ncbi:MAG: hypothetical protein HYY45_19880 [Deltaproteobacteria bacterium]|nr:hypothetical protein [Deltaproteobacteria bacterium]
MITHREKFLVFALVFLLSLCPLTLSAAEAPQTQEPPAQPGEPSVAEDLGYGVGSVLSSIFYSPFKITYAGLGLITGGLGFVLSAGNKDVALNIISPAVRGNYVVTPRHLKGEDPLIFVGPSAPEEPQQTAPTPSPQR